jgi:hypothetical protein
MPFTPADEVVAMHNLAGRAVRSGTLDMRAPAPSRLVSTGAIAIVPGVGGWRVELPARASAVWRIPR